VPVALQTSLSLVQLVRVQVVYGTLHGLLALQS